MAISKSLLTFIFTLSAFTLFAQKKLSAKEIVDKCIHSVVTIYLGKGDDLIGKASGVIISNKGYLVTNFHVLKGLLESNAEIAFIKDEDGKFESLGELVCYWEAEDLAIFKMGRKYYQGIDIAEGNELGKGSKVFTISSPDYLDNTISEGLVSNLLYKKDRYPDIYTRIVTNADFTHGSSGGAMIDEYGNLVGILVGGEASENGARANINYAIPILFLNALINTSECDIEKDVFRSKSTNNNGNQQEEEDRKPRGLKPNPGEVNPD